MFEDLNDAGSQLRRAPEQLRPGQVDRAHEPPPDQPQGAGRPRGGGKHPQDPGKSGSWALVASYSFAKGPGCRSSSPARRSEDGPRAMNDEVYTTRSTPASAAARKSSFKPFTLTRSKSRRSRTHIFTSAAVWTTCFAPRIAFSSAPESVRSPTNTEQSAAPGSNPSREASRTRTRKRSEEHTSELQSRLHLVCRLLLEKKKKTVRIPLLSMSIA